MPTPDADNKPAMALPRVMILSRYNSVIITLLAQFGIKPIKLVITGDSTLLLTAKWRIVSSSIMVFKIMLIIKIKKAIFRV